VPAPPTAPARFYNRELPGCSSIAAVLEEAANARHPLLERVRFLSIRPTTSTNSKWCGSLARRPRAAGITQVSQDA